MKGNVTSEYNEIKISKASQPFQLRRESNEKLSLYYICMLKENYWFQIWNNENSLLLRYMLKLYENKSNKCALSPIIKNAILQTARQFRL